jgi:hypothetical protein
MTKNTTESCCCCESTTVALGTTTQGERMCSECMREVQDPAIGSDWATEPEDWTE